MEIYRKIIIALIVLIFTYILIRLIKKRNEILHSKESFIPNIFSFQKTPDDQVAALRNTTLPVTLKNVNTGQADLPLREYCMKGAYNSAFTGKYISLDMVNYVLSRGVRFLDFEIYYILDEKSGISSPMVGYTTDNIANNTDKNKPITLESENNILLDNVLSAVISSAFSETSPNNADPLFINLRIKTNQPEIYEAVAKSIDFALKAKLYKEQLTNKTKMSDIKGKIVIIIDKTINRNYKDYTDCKDKSSQCYDLKLYTNAESGSEFINLTNYRTLLNQCSNSVNILDDESNLHTDVKRIKLALPDTIPRNAKNPNFSQFVEKYGCQIVPYKFYSKDPELEDYEIFFNENKSAFVPLATGIYYYNKMNLAA